MAADVQVYNSHGKKYEVPRRSVYSLSELQSGDHIAFHQMGCSYWHHAIVEHVYVEKDELDIIQYSNTAREFLNDNCTPPWRLGDIKLAKVMRERYNFQNGVVHLMLHEKCLDPASVVQRARSKLGEKQYSPLTNNCEHFAMWCKTGKRSSDQVKKAAEMLKKQLGTAAPCGAITAIHLGKATSTKILKSGVQVVTKKVVTQTVTKVGEEAMKTGVRMASMEVVSQTVSTMGKEAVKTGVRMASKEVVCQTVSTLGKEAVKTGVKMASKEVVGQTVSTLGKEAVKEVVEQMVSTLGKETVTTGVKIASKEVVGQTVSTVGKEAVKEVVAQTVSVLGKEAVKTGVKMASKEVVGQ